MVIGEITAENPFEMALVEDNHVIQTLPANATNDTFDMGILPRAPRCGGTFFHSQTVHASSKVISVDSIAITQQVLRRRLPWKSLNKLLRRPFGRWMLRYIKVDDLPSIVAQDDEHEQYTKSLWVPKISVI